MDSGFINLLWNNWLWVALLACLFYAIDNLIESLLVGRKIFINAVHGTIIINLLSAILFFGLPLTPASLAQLDLVVILMGVCGGLIYCLYNYFYLKSLSQFNDASNIKTFIGLRIFLLPILAAIFLGESLLQNHYLGIFVAAFGILCLIISSNRLKVSSNSLQPLIHTATIMLSFSMVIQAQVYHQIGFWSGFGLFVLGRIIAGTVFLMANETKNIGRVCKKYFSILVSARLIGLAAVILSQRAISLTPSVSFIAIIESLIPMYIMLLAAVLIPLCRYSRHRLAYTVILKAQLKQFPSKVMATVFVICGIVIITNETDFSITELG